MRQNKVNLHEWAWASADMNLGRFPIAFQILFGVILIIGVLL